MNRDQGLPWRVLRGAGIFVAMPIGIVLSQLLTLVGAPGARVLSMAGILVIYGPAPYYAAMTPHFGVAYFVVWPAVGLWFGVMTRRANSVRRLAALAAAATVVCLVSLFVIAERSIADDWRRQGPDNVRRTILARTPLGTSEDTVRSMVVRENWRLLVAGEEFELPDRPPQPATASGSKLAADAGEYQGFPLRVSTTISWRFDASGRLRDVGVWQAGDGP